MNQGETVKSDSLSTVHGTVEEKNSSLPMNQDEEEMVDTLRGTTEEKNSEPRRGS